VRHRAVSANARGGAPGQSDADDYQSSKERSGNESTALNGQSSDARSRPHTADGRDLVAREGEKAIGKTEGENVPPSGTKYVSISLFSFWG
jgi:hypothetical protein